MDALTGAPLPGVKIALYNNLRPPKAWQTASDSAGRFSLPDVPAGDTYELTATKRTYLRGSKPQYLGQALLAVDVSGLTEVKLPLMPQSVLAGTLVDASGQPIEGATLTARRVPFSKHITKGLDTESSAATNDLGRFRLAGLPPGEYQIIHSNDEVLARYRVGPGQVLDTLQITLPQPLRYSVRILLPATPSPPSQLTPRLLPGDHYGQAQSDGSFHFARVPPGNYTAVAATPNYLATASVSVRDTDVSGIQLRPAPRATLRGRLRVEGPRTLRLQGLPLNIQAPHANDLMFSTTADATGAFSIPDYPTGPADIHMDAPAGAYIRKIETKNGRTDILLSTATAAIEGTVEPPADDQRFGAGIVYLVPEGKWLGALHNRERYQALVTADLNFSMRDLAPGRYVAVASEAPLPEGVTADQLRALKSFSKVITLTAGPTHKLLLPHTRVEHLVAGSIDLAR